MEEMMERRLSKLGDTFFQPSLDEEEEQTPEPRIRARSHSGCISHRRQDAPLNPFQRSLLSGIAPSPQQQQQHQQQTDATPLTVKENPICPTPAPDMSSLKKASVSIRGLSNSSLSTMCPEDHCEENLHPEDAVEDGMAIEDTHDSMTAELRKLSSCLQVALSREAHPNFMESTIHDPHVCMGQTLQGAAHFMNYGQGAPNFTEHNPRGPQNFRCHGPQYPQNFMNHSWDSTRSFRHQHTMDSQSFYECPFKGRHEPVDPSLNGQQPIYMHKCVPKHVDLAKMYKSTARSSPPTTMMIRNIPNRYTQTDLAAELETMGFADTFDFLYLPVDKGTMGSVGYAFVNFVNPAWAATCMQRLHGHRFKGSRRNSGKPAVVSVAHLQGLEANLKHYERAAVTTAQERKLRPMVKTSLSQLIF